MRIGEGKNIVNTTSAFTTLLSKWDFSPPTSPASPAPLAFLKKSDRIAQNWVAYLSHLCNTQTMIKLTLVTIPS